MKFRILTYINVFTGLAMPIRLAAQVQQGQNKNQVHYILKVLASLGGTFSSA